ncbi:hypothetical protein M3Y99_01645800 [Aphelenchoides fujianensis]|nr:hypothetical protein M3Y99_01645800 [Aphelenchoides fujianensis]
MRSVSERRSPTVITTADRTNPSGTIVMPVDRNVARRSAKLVPVRAVRTAGTNGRREDAIRSVARIGGATTSRFAQPQRPKLFQQPADPSTSNEASKSWSTRIAAVATDDSQRSNCSASTKKDAPSKSGDAEAKPMAVAEKDVQKMRSQLSKMQQDLDQQYAQGRSFTHNFRGRGL